MEQIIPGVAGPPAQSTGQGPNASTNQPAGQGPVNDQPQTGQTSTDPKEVKLSDEAAKNRVRAVEAEKRASELQAKLDELTNAGKSDVERLTGELAKAKASQEATVGMVLQSQLMVAAAEAGLPGKAAALIIMADPALKAKVTYVNGIVSGLPEAIEAAKAAYPEIIKSIAPPMPTAPNVPATNPGGAGGRPLYTKAQLEGLTTVQVNADWEHVQKSMAALSGAAPTGAVK